MNDSPRTPGSEKINALLGQGTEFDGKLSFQGTVRIDGKFSGHIKAEGTLIIGEDAVVEAEVVVKTLLLKGTMTGNVTAEESVELFRTAKLTGNITTKTLSVEKGAKFNGECKMDTTSVPGVKPFGPPPEPPKMD